MTSNSSSARRLTLLLTGIVTIGAATAAIAISGTGNGHADSMDSMYGMHHDAAQGHVASATAKQQSFHDAMRALWEAHGAWTHMVIVSFVGNLPNLPAEEQVLLHNQVDIGNAIKPYYGAAAGTKLTKLLQAHIVGAVKVLEAAKSGDKQKLSSAETAWFANGRQIADFLHTANPHFLTRNAARQMMNVHLKQVIGQAVDELQGHYAAGARAFGPYIRHILDMADMISDGIIRQFPAKFS